MQVMFIDIYNVNNEFKNKFYFNLYNKNIIGFRISIDLILLLKKENKSFFDKIICKYQIIKIVKVLKKIDDENISAVFSNKIDNNIEYKNIILNRVLKNCNFNIYEVKEQNFMEENIEKYFDKYILNNNLKREDVKISYFLDGFNSAIYKNIINNINKYKYLDICYFGIKNSLKYKDIVKKVDLLNNELGSTIYVIEPNYNMEYNIYVNFSSRNIKSEYNILDKYLVVNWHDIENDIYNINNIEFEKNKFNIDRLFENIICKKESFSKNKIGSLIKHKILKI